MDETFICYACGEEHPIEERTIFDDLELCQDCLSSRTRLCICCGERIWNDDDCGDENITLCSDCEENHYDHCRRCGRLTHVDDLHYLDEDDDEGYCDECFNHVEHEPGVRNYYYKPDPIFYGRGNRYLCVDDMIVKADAAMKCAFGENPKRCYRDKCDSTRMSTAAILRRALFEARDYKARKDAAGGDIQKMPKFDMKMEALIPVLEKKIPLKAHAHQANDIFTALRIAREFDVDITLEHVTEGHLIADKLAQDHVPMAVGPTLTHASKFELQNKSWETPGVLAKAGCAVSIITDNSVIPQQYLPLCAGMAVKAGMDPFDALKAITINAARHAGVGERVGSLEPGKDADVVITEGCPFEVFHTVRAVIIDGERVL